MKNTGDECDVRLKLVSRLGGEVNEFMEVMTRMGM